MTTDGHDISRPRILSTSTPYTTWQNRQPHHPAPSHSSSRSGGRVSAPRGRSSAPSADPFHSIPFHTAYTPNKISPADDLITLYGLKPLYHAFVRPPIAPKAKEGAEGQPPPMIQLQQSIAALLPDQSSTWGTGLLLSGIVTCSVGAAVSHRYSSQELP
jgi:hypothetical protein